jgi:hypothetical protein
VIPRRGEAVRAACCGHAELTERNAQLSDLDARLSAREAQLDRTRETVGNIIRTNTQGFR